MTNTYDDGSTGYEFNGNFSDSNPSSITPKFPLGSWSTNLGFTTQPMKKEKKEKKEEKKEKEETLMGLNNRVPYYGPQLNLGRWLLHLGLPTQKKIKQPWLLKYIGFPSVRFPTVGSI